MWGQLLGEAVSSQAHEDPAVEVVLLAWHSISRGCVWCPVRHEIPRPVVIDPEIRHVGLDGIDDRVPSRAERVEMRYNPRSNIDSNERPMPRSVDRNEDHVSVV